MPEEELDEARIAIENFDGTCKACGAIESGWKARDFAFDHNHKTLKFRGIICQRCNVVIGQALESITRLLGIVRYLVDGL